MLLRQIAQVAVKIESQEGVPESLSASDVFLAFDPTFRPNITMTERNPVRTSISPVRSAPGRRSGVIGFSVELSGTGNAGDPFPFSEALKACGFSEEIVSGPGVRYKPTTEDIPTVTVAVKIDKKTYMIWGARGTVRFVFEPDSPSRAEFEFTGADFSVSDQGVFPDVSFPDIIAPSFRGANFRIDSFSAIISRCEIDMANDIILRSDVNKESGYREAVIRGRRPTISFDPEDVLQADYDFFSRWKDGALVEASFKLEGGAGNTIQITCPKVQFQDINTAERDGISTLEITGLLTGDDDEIQIDLT